MTDRNFVELAKRHCREEGKSRDRDAVESHVNFGEKFNSTQELQDYYVRLYEWNEIGLEQLMGYCPWLFIDSQEDKDQPPASSTFIYDDYPNELY